MRRVEVMSRATLSKNEHYKVTHNAQKDTFVLEIGGTSLTLGANKFIVMNEMMRKAAVRLGMQTKIY